MKVETACPTLTSAAMPSHEPAVGSATKAEGDRYVEEAPATLR